MALNLLDYLQRSCICSTFCELLTSEEWLLLLFQIIEEEVSDISHKILAARILETILPHLPYQGNMKRYLSITRKLFALLSSQLHSKKEFCKYLDTRDQTCQVMINESLSYAYTQDEEFSDDKQEQEDYQRLILDPTIPNQENPEAPQQAAIYIDLPCFFAHCFITFDIIIPKNEQEQEQEKQEEEKTSLLDLQVGLVSKHDRKVLCEGELGITSTRQQIEVAIVRNHKGKFYFGQSTSLQEISVQQSISEDVCLRIMCHHDKCSIEFVHEMSHWTSVFPLSSYRIPTPAILSQEIVELLTTLHKTSGWTDFINSAIRDIICKKQESIGTISTATSIMSAHGIYSGLRPAGYASYSMGSGTIQDINPNTSRVSLFTNTGEVISKDVSECTPMDRRPMDYSSLPTDKAFVHDLASLISPVTPNHSIEELDLCVSAVSALLNVLQTDNGRMFIVSPDCESSLSSLVSIAAQASELQDEWPLEHVQRMILNLKASLGFLDPEEDAVPLNLADILPDETDETKSDAIDEFLHPLSNSFATENHMDHHSDEEDTSVKSLGDVVQAAAISQQIHLFPDNPNDSTLAIPLFRPPGDDHDDNDDNADDYDNHDEEDEEEDEDNDDRSSGSTYSNDIYEAAVAELLSEYDEYSGSDDDNEYEDSEGDTESCSSEEIILDRKAALGKFFRVQRNEEKTENENLLTNEEYYESKLSSLYDQVIKDRPFPSALRCGTNTNQTVQKPPVSASYITKFGHTFENFTSDVQRTVLFLLQKHLQIKLARKCILVILSNAPSTWKLSDSTILQQILCVTLLDDTYNRSSKQRKKLFEVLKNLREDGENILKCKIQEFVISALVNDSYSNNSSVFPNGIVKLSTLLPLVRQSIFSSNDNTMEWRTKIVCWICCIILSKNFDDYDKVEACTLLSNIFAKTNVQEILPLFDTTFGKLFLDSLPDILLKQRKFESILAKQNSQSTFMLSLAPVAYVLKDVSCKDCTGPEWVWLHRYFTIIDTVESWNKKQPIPESLTSIVFPGRPSPSRINDKILPYEDNERWTPKMDEALLEWQTKYPEDWNESITVYVWGKGSEGQLGSITSSDITTPILSNEFGKFSCDIIGGERCTFVRTEEGEVYATGMGDYGRLGVGDNENRRNLTKLDFGGAIIKSLHSSRGSYGSTLALDAEHKLWSWGDGDYGKLGHGDRQQRSEPHIISALQDKTILSYNCGFAHSAAVTIEGKLYTWGHGDDGRLGHGDCVLLESPKLVEALDGYIVSRVACGANHTVALVNFGSSVWTWGCNEYGQLGNGSTSNSSIPIEIVFVESHAPFIKVECGDGFTGLLTKDGKVYTFGKGCNGALGLGEVSNATTPQQVEALDGQIVIDIKVGADHMIVLCKDGKIYTWGQNENGELGLGHTRSVYLPELVNFPKKIKLTSIASGSRHCFAFAKLSDSQLVPDNIREDYEILRPVFGPEIVSRTKILSKFSDMFFCSYNLINLDSSICPTFGVETQVWRLKREDKYNLLRQYISQTKNSSDDHGPIVHLNRFGRSPLFCQICEQLKHVNNSALRTKRAWKVEFLGEGSIDAGGPFNESMSHLAAELQSGKVSIIKPTPNAIKQVGNYQDCVFPVASSKETELELFQFLGKLFGISIRTHVPLPIQFPPAFWKLILGHSLKVEDLLEIDETFVNSHKYLIRVDEEGITEDTFNSLPIENFKPILVNGRLMELTFANRKNYVKAAFTNALHAWDFAIEHIKQSLTEFFSVSLLRLFSPVELGILVCGASKVDWNLLKKCTKYSDYESDSQTIQWLWDVLEELSPEDAGLFLRFTWGKTRLPHSVADFSHSFEVAQATGGDRDLPTAATCFFKLSLPNYSSKEILETKLLYAIRNCTSIDMDNNAGAVYFSDSESDTDSDSE